jgi:hypothetical protein
MYSFRPGIIWRLVVFFQNIFCVIGEQEILTAIMAQSRRITKYSRDMGVFLCHPVHIRVFFR